MATCPGSRWPVDHGRLDGIACGELRDGVCALAAQRLRAAVMGQAPRRADALEPLHGQSDGILSTCAGMARVLQAVHKMATTDLSDRGRDWNGERIDRSMPMSSQHDATFIS